MLRICFLLSSLLLAPPLLAEPFWGSKASQAVDIPADKLKPGQFIWKGDAVPYGPMRATINIPEQKIYVHRNGILIGVSTISTGRGRRMTPAGHFSVLGKARFHRSKKYDNAPMPFTHWLTSGGIGMHAGKLPGYPASHGCIRMPSKFARLVYESSYVGMPVTITREKTALVPTQQTVAIADKITKDNKTATPVAAEQFLWQPEAAEKGPISIVINKTEQRILVYRNGIEIGKAKLSFIKPENLFGTHAYILEKGDGKEGINLFLHNAPPQRWVNVGLPGYADKKGALLNSPLFENIRMPIEFAQALNSILTPGATLLVTAEPVPEQPKQATVAISIQKKPIQAITKPQNVPPKSDKLTSTTGSTELQSLDTQMEKLEAKLDKLEKEITETQKRHLE
jgi:hypothetical protein